jgi:glutathione S-transferase
MIVVHHLEKSRSQRVLWLLEELGLEYEVKHYKRDAKTMLAPAELKKVHPLGKSPVISDGKIVVAESGAIVEYLIDTYGEGRLKPKAGTQAARDYSFWMHFAEGSAMSPLLMALVMSKIPKAPMPFFAKPIAKAISKGVLSNFVNPQLKSHVQFIESTLAQSAWFAGDDLTGADIQMSFVLEALSVRGPQGEATPKIDALLKKIHERPAWKRAVERGGGFELLT